MIANRYFSHDSSIAFWHLPVFYDSRSRTGDPCFYPINFASKLQYEAHFDDQGIPLLDYKGYIGIRYNPCAIAQYALGCLAAYGESRDQKLMDKFAMLARWLVENLKKSDQYEDIYSWYYDFDLDAYNIKKPWNSAIAQGQGISVLARAYQLFQNKQYLDAAVWALSPFERDVFHGGLQRTIDGEFTCYEEVPTTDRASCVLDGFMYALMGLEDLAAFGKVDKAKTLWLDGVRCLQRILPMYDLGYWSKGDIYAENIPMVASRFYHKLHSEQLTHFHAVFKDDLFNLYAEKWAANYKSLLCTSRAYLLKILFKLMKY